MKTYHILLDDDLALREAAPMMAERVAEQDGFVYPCFGFNINPGILVVELPDDQALDLTPLAAFNYVAEEVG